MSMHLCLLALFLGFDLFLAAAAADRPNFLIIVTDDQNRKSLGAFGGKVCSTPHIDRLAREGMLLTDAYHMGSWSGAVCLPSRTMIMTGHGVWRLPGQRRGNPSADKYDPAEIARRSMAAVFNAAGYDTFRTCKAGNTFKAANKHFTVEFADSDGRNPDSSDVHAQRAIDYLNQRASHNDEDPFLMYLGFAHPHDPRNGKEELLRKYGAVNAKEPPTTVNPQAPPLPVNYLPEHPFHHGHPKLRDEVAVQGVTTSRSAAAVRNEQGREYACIKNIDRQIGRVLATLEELDLLDETYVIFTADHGIALGRHGLMGKQNLYEHSWRVPLLVRGPCVAAGGMAPGFIYLMDLLPTLCDLAGVETPEGVDGVSFRPVLEGDAVRVREQMYGVYAGGSTPGMRSIRTADGWKLIKYDVLDGAVRQTQLFDLNDNPHEFLAQHHEPAVVALTGHTPRARQTNLADDPRHAAKRRELESLLLEEMLRREDPYQLWDQPQVVK